MTRCYFLFFFEYQDHNPQLYKKRAQKSWICLAFLVLSFLWSGNIALLVIFLDNSILNSNFLFYLSSDRLLCMLWQSNIVEGLLILSLKVNDYSSSNPSMTN
jgi:hypothetical protein